MAHSYELTGRGTNLDVDYLLKLGPQVIPALDPLLAVHPDILYRKHPGHSFAVRVYRYNGLMQFHRTRMSDWRGWTFRDWRLMRDLDGRAELVVKHNGFTLRATPPAWVLDELGLPPDIQPPDF